MKKSLIFFVFALVGALVPWSVTAQGCQYINLKIDYRTYATIEERPIPPYDYDVCVEVAKITGNLNGRYVYCFNFADFLTSNSIYADGYVQIETLKYSSRIETSDGEIEIAEWSWYLVRPTRFPPRGTPRPSGCGKVNGHRV